MLVIHSQTWFELIPSPVHLPEYDTVAPDVGGGGEGPKVDALWRVPLDWPPASRFRPVTETDIMSSR